MTKLPFSPLSVLGDPAWMAMDLMARALHFQLLCVASQRRPAGTLPEDDTQWRKWCGIPLQKAGRKSIPMSDTLKAGMKITPELTTDVLAVEPEALAQHLWDTCWKPQVLQAWLPIDEALVLEHPDLARVKDGWWSPLAAAMADGMAKGKTAISENKSEKSARSRKPAPLAVLVKPTVAQEPAEKEARLELVDTTLELDRVWDDVRRVRTAWRARLPRPDRERLWDLGVEALDLGQGKRVARQQLGGLIRDYGEAPLAQALGVLVGRAVRPADPMALLVRLLKDQTQGSVAVQKARTQRARVAL